MIYLHFLHAPELAYLIRYMYTAIGNARLEDIHIQQCFTAVLFEKEPGGIDDAQNKPPKELAVYDKVCLLHNRFAGVPICLIDAMVMRIYKGKIYVERVTFYSYMVAKIVDYICNEETKLITFRSPSR